jgi:asparagine synthase (glutamine-hydrolysing)
LSPDGEQPFHSPDGHIHAIVNGELYQDDGDRQKLAEQAGWSFKGKSDCEIVIALYQIYGVSFLRHLRGEFALCLYDSRAKLFVCARDRYGIKPLVFSKVDGSLIIGAEIKALGPLGLDPEWDVQSIADRGYAHDTRTIFKGVHKVSRFIQNDYFELLIPPRSGQAATSLATRLAMLITRGTGT